MMEANKANYRVIQIRRSNIENCLAKTAISCGTKAKKVREMKESIKRRVGSKSIDVFVTLLIPLLKRASKDTLPRSVKTTWRLSVFLTKWRS